MGQVASAADNAAMESFFSLLQKNVLDRQPWRTREQLRIRIVTWIERTYHRRRRQAALGRLTPIEYEAIMTTPASQAAGPKLSPDRAADPHAAGLTLGGRGRNDRMMSVHPLRPRPRTTYPQARMPK